MPAVGPDQGRSEIRISNRRAGPASRAFPCLAIAFLSFAQAGRAAYADAPVQTGDFFIRGGYAYAGFDTNASVAVAGQAVPGANIRVMNNSAFEVEGGYYILPYLTVSANAGYPPTTRLTGTGTLSPLGMLGRVTYGTTVVALQYHAPALWRLRPYIGGGVDYTYIFNDDDGALKHLRVKNAFGPTLQGGADFIIDRHISLYGDIKKIWLKTQADASFPTQYGPLPSHTRIRLDPLVFNIGVSYRFW